MISNILHFTYVVFPTVVYPGKGKLRTLENLKTKAVPGNVVFLC